MDPFKKIGRAMSHKSPPKRNTVIVVDANNLAYRAYFAVRGLKTRQNVPTSVIFGFLKSMQTLVSQFKPRRVYIVWDPREKTWRHKYVEKLMKRGIYKAGYKSGRVRDKEWRTEFIPQVEALRKLIPMLGYFQYIGFEDEEGSVYEADDVIGSIAYGCATREYMDRVIIVSSDMDFFQLLKNEKIRIARAKKGASGKYTLWGKKRLVKKYGVAPGKMILIGAIMGDKGDNIEGIDGIGIVTATKIVKKHGKLKKLCKAIDAGKIIISPVVTSKLSGTTNRVKANYKLKRIVIELGIEPVTVHRDLHGLKKLLREEYEIEDISPYSLAKSNMDTNFNLI